MLILFLVGGVIAAFFVIRAVLRSNAEAAKRRRRAEHLMAKYGDEDLVNKLINGEYWQGMTEGQLLDSLGEPIERDEKKYKTKIREIYKYDQTSAYRFATRIFVENGIVVGWDLKGDQSTSGVASEENEIQKPEPSREFKNEIQTPEPSREFKNEIQTPEPSREFNDFMRNDEEASRLEDLITEAREHKKPLGHLLLIGPPGFSGSTVARIVARQLNANCQSASTVSVKRAGDVAELLTNLEERDVLFIDDIHQLKPDVVEVLYPAIKDFQLDLVIGEGPATHSVKIDLAEFTLIGASSAENQIAAEVRKQFTHWFWVTA
jgi:hypothetical protein